MKLLQNGEQSIVLELSYYGATAGCVGKIRDIYRSLQQHPLPGILSIRPGLDRLLIEYSDDDLTAEDIEKWMLSRPAAEQERHEDRIAIKVPVCYENEFAPDLDIICRYTGLSKEEVIEIHTSTTYEVWMIGFMPGFPYLGKLDDRLKVPRKQAPAALLAAGSVAIAEEFVGVYPFDSPGGWHVIGRTPWVLTDYTKENPFLFKYGMRANFYPISPEEFVEIRQKVSG